MLEGFVSPRLFLLRRRVKTEKLFFYRQLHVWYGVPVLENGSTK